MTETVTSNKLKKAGWVFVIGALFGAMIIYALHDNDRTIPYQVSGALNGQQQGEIDSLVQSLKSDSPVNLKSARMMAKASAPMIAEGFAGNEADAAPAEKRTIAYTHSLTVEVKNYDSMKTIIDRAVKECQQGKSDCELLNENISQDREYPNGSLSLRLMPDGVTAFKALVSEGAIIRNESTSSEQLSEQMTDLDQRLKTRTDYLNRLQELALQKGNLEDTLRVQQELSNVIAEIESLKSQNRQTEKRVEKEMLTVSFQVAPPPTATSAPLDRALKEFGRTVGTSFARMVTTLGVLLPWIIAFVIVMFVFRILLARNWLKRKNKDD